MQECGLRAATGFVCSNIVCRTDDRCTGEPQEQHQHDESDLGGCPREGAVTADHYFGPMDVQDVVTAEKSCLPTEIPDTCAAGSNRVGQLYDVWVGRLEWPARGQQNSQRVFAGLAVVADSRCHATVS